MNLAFDLLDVGNEVLALIRDADELSSLTGCEDDVAGLAREGLAEVEGRHDAVLQGQGTEAPGEGRDGAAYPCGSAGVTGVRKAAEPGMVEQIASYLSDNPLTHSWRDSVGGAINWAERRLASEEELRSHIGHVIEKGVVNGAVGDEQVRLLEQLKGGSIDRERLEALAAQHPGGVADYLGQAATRYMKEGDMDADALRAQLAGMQGPLQQRGDLAHAAALVATHPAMAYSAVTAGGAMATAAGIQAYDWWMAQQQQAEKDKQLPLVKEQEPLLT